MTKQLIPVTLFYSSHVIRKISFSCLKKLVYSWLWLAWNQMQWAKVLLYSCKTLLTMWEEQKNSSIILSSGRVHFWSTTHYFFTLSSSSDRHWWTQTFHIEWNIAISNWELRIRRINPWLIRPWLIKTLINKT